MRRKVVEWLIWQLENEVDNKHFNMECFLAKVSNGDGIIYRGESSIPFCKTAGCIAGTLFLRMPKKIRLAWLPNYKFSYHLDYKMVEEVAAKQLGLEEHEAETLFMPSRELKLIGRKHAIAVLKLVLETSKINWRSVLPASMHNDLYYYAREPLRVELTDN